MQSQKLELINIGATGLKYPSSATTNRNYLINNRMWVFTGDIAQNGECDVKPMVFKIKTDNPGQSCPTCFEIVCSNTYPSDIDWNGDGIFDEFNKIGIVQHNYGIAGVYTVQITIRSKFRFQFFKNDHLKLVSFDQWGDTKFSSLTNGFANCQNMQYTANDNPDLSELNLNSIYGLFSNCTLFNGDISGWDVSNIEDFSLLFENASSFNQPLSEWNTSKVKNLLYTFKGATSFNQNINNWDVSSCTALVGTFMNAKSFNQPLSGWNTSNVEVMGYLFNGAESFNQDINNWNTSACTSLTNTFESALSFNQSLSNWDVSKIGTFYFTFKNAQNFDQSLGNWKFAKDAKIIDGVFDGSGISCFNFSNALESWSNNPSTNKNIWFSAAMLKYSKEARSHWDKLSNEFGWTITYGKRQGSNCDELKPMILTYKTDNPGGSCNSCVALSFDGSSEIIDVDWNNDGLVDQKNAVGLITHNFGTPGTYKIRIYSEYHYISFGNQDSTKLISLDQWGESRLNGARLFENCTNLRYNAIDNPLFIGNSMYSMFYGCRNFDGDLSDWDVSKITNMGFLFGEASSFNGNIENWDVSNVIDMNSIFFRASKFNQNINKWDVSNVKNLSQLFTNASSFNQPMDQWDVSNVIDMTSIFLGASKFNHNINSWNVSNVKNLDQAFSYASSFNQPLDQWDVSNVENMQCIFCGASNFNKNINGWNVSNVKSLTSAFANASTYNQPLENWDVSKINNLDYMFVAASNFNQPLSKWTFAQQCNLENFLFASGMSCDNYSNSLIGWAENPLQPNNLSLGCGGMKFQPSAKTSRDKLINQKGWTFQGDIEGSCDPARPMIITIDTRLTGGSCNSCYTIGNESHSLNFDVDWDNDGLYDNKINGEFTHNFTQPGIYSIKIKNHSLYSIFFNKDSDKLISFDQWGDIDIFGEFFFWTCSNMVYRAVDSPRLTGNSIRLMFSGCKKFNGNLSSWDVSKIENMSSLFFDASSFNQNINNWDVGNVKNMGGIFSNTISFDQPLDKWNVSNVEDLSTAFFNSKFNQNINNWNVSNVKNLDFTFAEAFSFNQPLDKWNVSQVESINSIFSNAKKFNQNVNNWNISKITSLQNVFNGTLDYNQPLDKWDVSNVINLSGTFVKAISFNQNINNWNVSKVKDMNNLFSFTDSYNQPLDKWDVSNVEIFYNLFTNSISFNQDINNWNVSNGKSFFGAFYNSIGFDQSLSDWTITSATNLEGFCDNSGMSCENYS